MHCLEGTLERITYYNEETLFLVARLRCADDGLNTIIGNMPKFAVGERLKVQGDWFQHKEFGRQFKVQQYEVVLPHNEKGIERFLASGLIKGVGPSTAEKIVEHFGVDALEIIENDPGRLCEVEGIGVKKAATISDSLAERQEIMKVMTFLQSYGVTIGFATRIYRKYGEETVARVSENPYRLAEDVFGVGFKTADKMALEMGITADSPHRIRAALLYLLKEAQDEGHVFLPRDSLLEKTVEALSTGDCPLSTESVQTQLEKLCQGGQLMQEEYEGEAAVYQAPLYYAERYVAQRLREIASYQLSLDTVNLGRVEAEGINLAPAQKQAVQQALDTGLLVVTGGPGTGKTTTIRSLLALFQQHGLEVMLAAPTGRATKRMTEATGMEAKTIHRLLEYAQSEGDGFSFQRNEERPLKSHVVIVDEASMVDLLLFYHLLKAIPPGCKLILVGDMDQLPSVGAGNVLRDIINSEAVPVAKLDRIFRQSGESAIITNAHRVNQGEMPQLNGEATDFFFINEKDPEQILGMILDLCGRRLPKYKNSDAIADIQVLSPMRRHLLGVDNLNVHLQKTLNPPAPFKTEMKGGGTNFRLGDKVMQIRNNYQKEVFNGDIGFISFINKEDGEMIVRFPDVGGAREVIYDQAELDELSLSYAVSVHKSQGSEYPIVVLPVVTQHYILLQRNLLYTAITRAKELVVLVGTKKALAIAVKNNKVEARYTRLAARLAEKT
ncbi:SF1B family DNA helicase RecD2 [Dethiobacter alkaliphilus]|uniref:SF1B family DNA helicase RecD2 n=1 Tax=Dethiobacter alkaliphilus TaxID=427926 RepID=UPI002226B015|nr:ATP-dependent RecD-like DNA helicase [Dethiobacter alkaliphilus]MCW3488645.1 ATP-dependent RecD-like DNA helicase [Dethiobacter alkaliphilus]